MRTDVARKDVESILEPVEDKDFLERQEQGPANEIQNNFKIRPLLGIYLPPAILLLVFFLVSLKLQVPFGMLTRDLAEITHASPFLGVISNIGILLWCSSAAICMLSFLLLRKDPMQKRLSMFFGSLQLLRLY
jgi:hypothetical protein